MPRLRLALAQVDLVVGDLPANSATVLEQTRLAHAEGADLIAFPEMTLTGYPPEDLVLRKSFGRASVAALESLAAQLKAEGLGDIAVIVGYLGADGGPRNAAAFVHDGRIVATYFKHHLPNYGVFDEHRYFAKGDALSVVRFRGIDIALTICEDAWQDGGPFAVAKVARPGLIVNINGSPYEMNKDEVRLPLLRRRAAEAGCTVAYVNMVGGQDELVFDGDSFVVSASGDLLARSVQFDAALDIVDLDLPAGLSADELADAATSVPVPGSTMRVERFDSAVPARDALPGEARHPAPAVRVPDEAEVWAALVLGTRDYVSKNGFRSVTLGLSGGIDSAVVAAIAADAIGGHNVYGLSMPSVYSSDHSRSDAEELAERIGANYRQVSIAPMVDAFVSALDLKGLSEENVQARVRGTLLMGVSNQDGHLVLATGNKSELAVGYSTIYGDAVGGYAPLKDVPKTLVFRLARWRNDHAAAQGQRAPIPENSISKPPSAELRPGQLDSDSLPDYDVLDAVIDGYVDHDLGVDELVAQGFDRELVQRVARLVNIAEWKRRQYPPGPKISLKAFGRDRRLPITNHWRESTS